MLIKKQEKVLLKQEQAHRDLSHIDNIAIHVPVTASKELKPPVSGCEFNLQVHPSCLDSDNFL